MEKGPSAFDFVAFRVPQLAEDGSPPFHNGPKKGRM
ncbi:unnamed protein product, partial [marine sediment metagenome]